MWDAFARQGRALVDRALRLHGDDIGTSKRWMAALGVATREGIPWEWIVDLDRPERRHDLIRAGKKSGWLLQWDALLAVVDHWLQWGGVRLRPEWDARDGPRPKLSSPWGLFGNLAMHLLFAVCRTHGWVACANAGAGEAGCSEVFFPTRAPRPGTHSWCAACRRKARSRAHSRAWYVRNRREIRRRRARAKAG